MPEEKETGFTQDELKKINSLEKKYLAIKSVDNESEEEKAIKDTERAKVLDKYINYLKDKHNIDGVVLPQSRDFRHAIVIRMKERFAKNMLDNPLYLSIPSLFKDKNNALINILGRGVGGIVKHLHLETKSIDELALFKEDVFSLDYFLSHVSGINPLTGSHRRSDFIDLYGDQLVLEIINANQEEQAIKKVLKFLDTKSDTDLRSEEMVSLIRFSKAILEKSKQMKSEVDLPYPAFFAAADYFIGRKTFKDGKESIRSFDMETIKQFYLIALESPDAQLRSKAKQALEAKNTVGESLFKNISDQQKKAKESGEKHSVLKTLDSLLEMKNTSMTIQATQNRVIDNVTILLESLTIQAQERFCAAKIQELNKLMKANKPYRESSKKLLENKIFLRAVLLQKILINQETNPEKMNPDVRAKAYLAMADYYAYSGQALNLHSTDVQSRLNTVSLDESVEINLRIKALEILYDYNENTNDKKILLDRMIELGMNANTKPTVALRNPQLLAAIKERMLERGSDKKSEFDIMNFLTNKKCLLYQALSRPITQRGWFSRSNKTNATTYVVQLEKSTQTQSSGVQLERRSRSM